MGDVWATGTMARLTALLIQRQVRVMDIGCMRGVLESGGCLPMTGRSGTGPLIAIVVRRRLGKQIQRKRWGFFLWSGDSDRSYQQQRKQQERDHRE